MKPLKDILAKQVNAASVQYTADAVANSIVVAVENDRFFIESEKQIDADALKTELLKDLEYQQKFLESVAKKLGNERFVQNAKPKWWSWKEKNRPMPLPGSRPLQKACNIFNKTEWL